MSRTGKQIAIAEAVAINKALNDSMFSDDEIALIIKLAWTARRSDTTNKGNVYEKIASLIQDVATRHREGGSGLVEK
jgi:hypothetical protein